MRLLLRRRWWHIPLVLCLAITLVLADEMVALVQFNGFCRDLGVESTDVTPAKGREIRSTKSAQRRMTGTAVAMWQSDVQWQDVANGAVLIQHQDFWAEGGWLADQLGRSRPAKPILFDGAACPTARRDAEFRLFDVRQANAP